MDFELDSCVIHSVYSTNGLNGANTAKSLALELLEAENLDILSQLNETKLNVKESFIPDSYPEVCVIPRFPSSSPTMQPGIITHLSQLSNQNLVNPNQILERSKVVTSLSPASPTPKSVMESANLGNSADSIKTSAAPLKNCCVVLAQEVIEPSPIGEHAEPRRDHTISPPRFLD